MKTETEISGVQGPGPNVQSQVAVEAECKDLRLKTILQVEGHPEGWTPNGEENVQGPRSKAQGQENPDIERPTSDAEHRVAEAGGGVPGLVMKKVRADAKWNGLSGKQREALEGWLFEERLGYEVTLEKARKELGFKGSVSSIRRFYERTAEERMLRSLVASQEQVNRIKETPGSAEELRAAGMKVVAQLFLRQVVQAPEQVKEWSRLAKLLLQSESNEIRFRLKREENELRHKALEFAREKFHYDILEEGKKVLPQLQELWEAGLTEYEQNKRTNDLRRRMWPDVPNLPDLLPESEEQEKEMAAQKIIIDAERAKQHEWWYKRFGSPEAKARIAAGREADRAAARRTEEEAAENVEPPLATGEVVERGVVYPYGQ